jgi:hypothetical protein
MFLETLFLEHGAMRRTADIRFTIGWNGFPGYDSAPIERSGLKAGAKSAW